MVPEVFDAFCYRGEQLREVDGRVIVIYSYVEVERGQLHCAYGIGVDGS